MALNRIDPGIQYFPQFSNDRAIAGAQIFIGLPDMDPQIPANQVQAYIIQENGTQVSVPQPVRTGAGGVPIYNGSPVQIGTEESSYSLKILNSYGSQIYYQSNSADYLSTNASQIAFVPPQRVFPVNNLSVQEAIRAGVYNIAWDDRFKQDKVTDNTTVIAEAIANAYAENCALYIPSAPPGFYASVEGGILIQNLDDFVMFGHGTQSLFVNQSTSGEHLITLDASKHARIRGLGLTGVTGAGSGIRIKGASHLYKIENVWAGWIDGDAAFDLEHGISGRFIGCEVDENNGYDPAGLGFGRGNTKRAWWIRSQIAGQNNDTNLISCVINGSGADNKYALQIGTPGGTPVESFEYQGLIQGGFRGVYFAAARDAHIRGTHIEPPLGAQPDYLVRFENSNNCTIEGRNIQGDVLIVNSQNIGLKSVRLLGINVDADSQNPYFEHVNYGNSSVGPASGAFMNASLTARIKDTTNSSSEFFAVGDNIKGAKNKLLSNSMSKIVYSGGSPLVPCGFEKFGTYTSTLAGGISLYGGQVFQINHTGDFTQGFKIRLAPISQIRGRRVTVDALVVNRLVLGGAYILLETFGGAAPGIRGQNSFGLMSTERMQVTFTIPVDATAADLVFTGITGAEVNWVSIDIDAEDFTMLTTEDASVPGSAEVDVSFNGGSERGGYPLRVISVGAGSNITNFKNPHVGVPFTIRFTASRTVVNSATLKLSGGVNFSATADDTITLEYGLDNIFREISRSVN